MTRLLAVLLSLVWALFVAFNAVFSDALGGRAQAEALVYVLLAYAGLAFAFGLLAPRYGLRWALWLAPPGVAAVLLSLVDDPGRPLYSLLVVLAIVFGAAGGAWLGSVLGRGFTRRRMESGRNGGARKGRR